jgi:hypothetical protein
MMSSYLSIVLLNDFFDEYRQNVLRHDGINLTFNSDSDVCFVERNSEGKFDGYF